MMLSSRVSLLVALATCCNFSCSHAVHTSRRGRRATVALTPTSGEGQLQEPLRSVVVAEVGKKPAQLAAEKSSETETQNGSGVLSWFSSGARRPWLLRFFYDPIKISHTPAGIKTMPMSTPVLAMSVVTALFIVFVMFYNKMYVM